MRFKANQLSMLVSTLFMAGGMHAMAADTSDLGKITVQGAPGGTDSGLIQQEDTPKARSSVNRSYMDKQSTTANPFQQLALLPGVNTADNDSTGLFGGNIRVRGFNSDQLGFTINGAPVNDSGSFAVYPQEYTDPENLCEVFVTQGSTDTEAPHVGATGGNIGMTTCDPADKFGVRASYTVGSESLFKNFVRVDSGKFLGDRAKFFISYSKAEADKFRGLGKAKKEHIDFGASFDLGSGSFIKSSLLYNHAINNNYRSLTKAQIAQLGWYGDFGTVAPVHAPQTGAVQNDNTYNPGVSGNYYGLNLNPFRNYLATLNGHFQINPKASIDVDPYFWYGFGIGGNELQTLAEGAAVNSIGGTVPDLNGDGDKKDTLFVYEGSRTRTYRPGVTTKFNLQLGDHALMAGYWFERARHQQTGQYVNIDNSANSADIWLDDSSKWLKDSNGAYIQYRDTMTISTGKSAFVQDSMSLLQDKLNLQVGVRDSGIDRDFVNHPAQSTGAGAYYALKKSYSEVLPSFGARYQLAQDQSVFFNVAKNFKAPGNFSYFGLATVDAKGNVTVRDPSVKQETSINYDLGYRVAKDNWTFSGSVFYVDYQDRIATMFDPAAGNGNGSVIDLNVGNVKSHGLEMESAYTISKGFTAYGSVSWMKSRMESNIPWAKEKNGTIDYLPLAGKEQPDSPDLMGAFMLQYAQDNWYVFSQTKYTGKRYSTLVNDDSIGGYTLVNLGAGVTMADTGFFKKPAIKFNVSNLFDKRFLSMASASGSQYTPNAVALPGAPAKAPSFYTSAPRAFSVTLSAAF